MTLASLLGHLKLQPPSHERKSHYQFGKTLGAGAFGVVKQAHFRDTNEDVAVKVILKSKLGDRGEWDSVLHEFNLLEGLDHPHIVKMREWFESKDKMYMVTQLCTGGELFDRIIDRGSFTERDAARVLREAASAVQYLHHHNIVHRDIKPENLLYSYASSDGSAPLLLCDFGVAQSLMSSEELIMYGAGSLGYAAPEIFGDGGHSKPADVWSLGVVLYTSLSGVSPFQAEDAESFMQEVQPGYRPYFYPEYWSQISDEAKDLVVKMLKYDPHDRFTIDQVMEHPWVHGFQTNAKVDLLPTLRPKLKSRKHWRAAYERVRLARMLKHLNYREDEEEEDSKPADMFAQVVTAALAKAQAERDVDKREGEHPEEKEEEEREENEDAKNEEVYKSSSPPPKTSKVSPSAYKQDFLT